MGKRLPSLKINNTFAIPCKEKTDRVTHWVREIMASFFLRIYTYTGSFSMAVTIATPDLPHFYTSPPGRFLREWGRISTGRNPTLGMKNFDFPDLRGCSIINQLGFSRKRVSQFTPGRLVTIFSFVFSPPSCYLFEHVLLS